MITKAMLDQLRAERERHNADLEYTIGGTIETSVVSSIEAERERKIIQGEQSLQNALNTMRAEQSYSSHKGLAKTYFNHCNQDHKESEP